MRASVLLLALFVSVALAQPFTLYHLVNNQIRAFRTDSATLLAGPTAITGADSAIVTFTYRVSNGQFYALSRNSTLYTLNINTGAVTLVGSISCPLAASPVTYYSAFNPAADALRVVGSDASNRRLFGTTFNCSVDGSLTYSDNTVPTPVGVAYINQVFPVPATTAEYITDANGARFSRVVAPNPGNTSIIANISSLPIAASVPLSVITVNSVDYVYALGTNGTLYSVNVATGAFTAGPTYAAGDAIVIAPLVASATASASRSSTPGATTPGGGTVAAATNPPATNPAATTPGGPAATVRSTTSSAVTAAVSIAAVAAVIVNMM